MKKSMQANAQSQIDLLTYLRDYKPRVYTGATSMISLIVPPTTNLTDLRQTMKREAQTATNIKSSSNRKSVQTALRCVNEYLKTLKTPPDTGLALFSEQFV